MTTVIGIRKSLVIGGMWMILSKPSTRTIRDIRSSSLTRLPTRLVDGSMWYYNVSHDSEFQYVASFMCGFMGCLFWTAWVGFGAVSRGLSVSQFGWANVYVMIWAR